MVIGIAPDGGRLSDTLKDNIRQAIDLGLSIDSGLHDYLAEDHDFLRGAVLNKVHIRDVRKPPPKNQLHFFSGIIKEVDCLILAILGTDSCWKRRIALRFQFGRPKSLVFWGTYTVALDIRKKPEITFPACGHRKKKTPGRAHLDE